MKILHLDSSILADNSVTRQLSAQLAAQIQSDYPGTAVSYHDLTAEPIAHLSGGLFAAQAMAADERSAAQAADVAMGEKVMEEFLAADIVVIGAPMYNFSIPSQLKAWIDRIAVAGKTFRYGENGAEGLVKGKKVIVISSRGGVYSGTPLEALDHQESYLRAVFGFIGVTDVKIIRAEGVNMGAEKRQAALAAASADIRECKSRAA